jgi:outer membrane protein assembly factor BamB
MPRLRVRIFSAFVLALILSVPRLAAAWEFVADGPAFNFHLALAVATDDREHVIAAGRVHSGGIHRLFAVKLHQQDGGALWRYEPILGSSFEMFRAVSVDRERHAIVAGLSDGRFTVIKLDGNSGVPHWIRMIDGGDAFGVAVDAAGDVIAAGTIGDQLAVVKFRGDDGAPLWTTPILLGAGAAQALALDDSGDIVVAGFLRNAAGASEFAVVKLSGTGTEQWRYQITNSDFGGAIAVAMDGRGDAVAVGSVAAGNANDSVVVKLAGATGAQLWRSILNDPESFGFGEGLALDRRGDVVVVGGAQIDGVFQSVIVKLAALDGQPLWRHATDVSVVSRVDVDKGGDVVAVGRSTAGNRSSARKLSTSGNLVWTNDDVRIASGFAFAIVSDDERNAVIAGQSPGGDFAVVKLEGKDGSDF